MALSYSINATAVTPAVAPAINPAVTSMLLLVTSNALKMVKTNYHFTTDRKSVVKW